MRIVFLCAALAAPLAPAAAQTDARPLPITAAQARTLPPAKAAELVFRDLATQMTAMTRPDPPRPDEASAPLTEITFASAPRSAGDPGLCAATVVHAGVDRPHTAEDIAMPGLVATEIVYKVVGDVEAASFAEADRAAQEKRCAAAGPVISPDVDDQGRAYFFSTTGVQRPFAGVAALQQAIRSARSGSYGAIACEDPDSEGEAARGCADPVKILAALELANLTSLETVAPARGGKLIQFDARFAVSADRFWIVELDSEFTVAPDGARIFRPVRTKLTAGRIFNISEDLRD